MTSPVSYPDHIAAIKPYIPGKPISEVARLLPGARIVKLASNENPLGASPKAMEALAQAQINLSLYPDNDCADLVSAIAKFHGVGRETVVVGAGSESIIGTSVSTLLSIGRRTSFSQYSFQAYVNAAQRVGATPLQVASPDFHVDLSGLRQTLAQDPTLIYIANPGNPTGTCVDPMELETFIRSVPSHVVVLLDEAYYEYMPTDRRLDSIRLATTLPNVLVTRTFSKAYGLAGLRIGYGIAHPGLAEMLRRVRAPFTVSEAAQRAAIAALDDQDFLTRTVETNARSKAAMQEGLTALGLTVINSHTNFFLVKVADGADWAHRLEQRGLIVRPVGSYGLGEWIRISIGTMEDTQLLIEACKAELGKPPVTAA